VRIDSVDFFYLAMPQITTEADGSQDALLVRVRAGGHEGWGECEAAPLPSIAAFVCPMSHGVCRPVGASILGETLAEPGDIARMSARVRYDSMDLLQAAHTLSGVEMAMWDLLGRARGEPVWRLLGYRQTAPKLPYASVLFGHDAQQTLERARTIRANGFRAAKFGWGPIGMGSAAADRDHFVAAREGLGADGVLLVDVGQIFREDVDRAAERLPELEACKATWLEEPFEASAYEAYGALTKRCSTLRLAGGEGAHDTHMARHLIDIGKVGYIQIDCGRLGGIGPAKAIADYAAARGVTYVNHTFTSNLALSASLQPYAGLADHHICEYPTMTKPVAQAFTRNRIERDGDGHVRAPDAPGLGIEVAPEGIKAYLVDAEIKVGGKILYRTPAI
jgi:L-alanine-DL-glutamate epimerase-like enolase superfamily enzyme